MVANYQNSRLDRLEKDVTQLKQDVASIKTNMDAIEDMADTVNKLYNWIKRGLPLVATACVTSGIVSGKWGAFIQALFH